jgi:hypothetical protein
MGENGGGVLSGNHVASIIQANGQQAVAKSRNPSFLPNSAWHRICAILAEFQTQEALKDRNRTFQPATQE